MLRKLLILVMFTGHFAPAFAIERCYELQVSGLACPYCAYGIERKLKALEGVTPNSVDIRLNEGKVNFVADTHSPYDEARLEKLVNDAGFTLTGIKSVLVGAKAVPHER